MRTVLGMLSKLEKIDIENVIYDALSETERNYAERQRTQMTEGFNSNGKRIGTYSNPLYKAMKIKLNPIAQGYTDLKLTGDFQSAIEARTDNEGLRIFSTDIKASMLQKKYGDKIFGLAPKNRNEYIKQNLRPETLKIVVSKLS